MYIFEEYGTFKEDNKDINVYRLTIKHTDYNLFFFFCFLLWLQIAIEPSDLFRSSFDHHENMPI